MGNYDIAWEQARSTPVELGVWVRINKDLNNGEEKSTLRHILFIIK